MKTFTFLLISLIGMGVYAQYEMPIDFENPEEDTAWTVFANGSGTEADFGLIENPDNTGINESDYCLMFIVADDADPWVGAWSEGYGTIEFTEENHVLEMMVYKDVITRVGLKFEPLGGGAPNIEILVENTLVNEWELMTFDFTEAIGNTYYRFVIFPDFPEAREGGSVSYVDKMGWEGSSAPDALNTAKTSEVGIYPNPATNRVTIEYTGMKGFTVSNVLGQVVLSQEFSATNRKTIEVSDLQSGLYFIVIEAVDGTTGARFIKE